MSAQNTDPIRRYPDLVCHRALLLELGQGGDAPLEVLSELAEHCSLRERDAAQVAYAADALCLAWLLEHRLFELGWEAVFPGEIIGIIESGLSSSASARSSRATCPRAGYQETFSRSTHSARRCGAGGVAGCALSPCRPCHDRSTANRLPDPA